MIKLQTQFKVRIIYKSGYVQEFWCVKFSIKNGNWSWESATTTKPIMLGLDEIAAVYQTGMRRRLTF